MIAVRRMRAHAALFGAVFGVALVLATLATGLGGYLDGQAREAVRSGLTEGDGVAVQVFDVPKVSDTAARDEQDRRGQALIASTLAALGQPPVAVESSSTSSGNDWLWTVSPDLDRVGPDDVAALAALAGRVGEALRADTELAPRGVAVTGTLDARARQVQTSIAPLAAVRLVPVLFAGAIGVVALSELGRLLVGVRTRETSLLRSRGATATRLGAAAALESALVSAAGAAAGIGISLVLLRVLGPPTLSAPFAVTAGAVIVTATVVLVGGRTGQSARVAFRRDTSDDVGRVRRLADPLGVALLIAAAAFSVGRFLQLGSPLAPTASGAAVDPLAVLAPVLTVAAFAVVGLALLPVFAGVAERAASRGPGLGSVLVARQLSRRVRMFASPIVLTAIAVGGIMLAAAYQSTWQESATQTAALHDGADLVVSGDVASSVDDIRRIPGVEAAAAVAVAATDLDGGGSFDTIAIPVGALAHVVTPVSGQAGPAELAAAIGVTPAGVPIPTTGGALRATITWTGAEPELTAQLVDADGRVAAASFTVDPIRSPAPTGVGGTLRVTAQLPATASPEGWLLAGIDVYLRVNTTPGSPPLQVSGAIGELSAVAGSGTAAIDLGSPWTMVANSAQLTATGSTGYAGSLVSGTTVRMIPAAGAATPVVLSSALAERLGVVRGQNFSLQSGVVAGPLPATVADIVSVVPGSSGDLAALVDLSAAQTQSVRAAGSTAVPDRVWVRTADPRAVAARLDVALPAAQTSGRAIDPALAALAAVPRALWAGMAGGVLLAIVALAAVAGELLRLRADEVAVLRALGMPSRQVVRARMLELLLACGGGAVVGAIGGAVAAFVVVPGLARAAVLDPYTALPTLLRVDGAAIALAVAVLAVAVLGAGAVYGRLVARGARRATTREDVA